LILLQERITDMRNIWITALALFLIGCKSPTDTIDVLSKKDIGRVTSVDSVYNIVIQIPIPGSSSWYDSTVYYGEAMSITCAKGGDPSGYSDRVWIKGWHTVPILSHAELWTMEDGKKLLWIVETKSIYQIAFSNIDS
jgi:hypothetical protein